MTSTLLQNESFGFRFENTYHSLPPIFHVDAVPEKVPSPHFALFNTSLATSLGLNEVALRSSQGAAALSGNDPLPASLPLAQAYAGHQFGHFTVLGDGRAILLGEHRATDSLLYDVQLKGSGQTRFSRRGDGKAALGPMLREYVISEAMAALGIPTTRSLAVVDSGEVVYRETPKRGAILTRIAASHIRVGTFEFAAARASIDELTALTDYTIARHFPELVSRTDRYEAFLDAVVARQARLIAQWLQVGFIHGVMNTDNMAISGETIDYGPCAFMDEYDPLTVFSSIDSQGRYSYGNQPSIALWNLSRLGEALLPLIAPDEAAAIRCVKGILDSFPKVFHQEWLGGMRRKLGLFSAHPEDQSLVQDFLQFLHTKRVDFTNAFRALGDHTFPQPAAFQDHEFHSWRLRWESRFASELYTQERRSLLMNAANPAVIPRNYLVEKALQAAEERKDYSVVQALLCVLTSPFSYSESVSEYTLLPLSTRENYRTFCGT
jgi:uncharacterized protein YdiU (UPF0061 family)